MTQSVRIVYFDGTNPHEEVVPVVDGFVDVSQFIDGLTITRLLPENVMIMSSSDAEFDKVNPHKVAEHVVFGDFCITRVDSTCSPVSLTDEQVSHFLGNIKAVVPQNTRVVEVANVVVRYEKVEVPSTCPCCKADLTADNAIRVFEYQDQSDLGRLIRDESEKEDISHCLGVLISDTSGLEAGETFIHNTAISCIACGNVLVEGDFDVYEAESGSKPTPLSKDMIHDKGTGREDPPGRDGE